MSKKPKMSWGDIFGMAFAFAIVAIIGVTVVQPNMDFFRGSSVNVPSAKDAEKLVIEGKDPSFVVKYLKSGKESEVRVGENVNLGSYGLIVGYGKIEITSLSFVLTGVEQSNFDNFSLKLDDAKVEDAEFEWLADGSLLVKLVKNPLTVEPNSKTDFVVLDLDADVVESGEGHTAEFHFVGATFSKNITNIGIINGGADPIPQKIKIISE